MLRTVTLLGATGSIGKSTRAVVAENPERLRIGAVVAGRDVEALARVAIETGASFAALADAAAGPALAEALARQQVRRVHPVQYALVGLALALFFLLLLSLSEHLPFPVAYAIAAGAAAGVLTPYAAAMLGSGWRGLAFGGGIGLLYAALYVLLSREQTALVIGSVLLFAVLAVVMTLTRRLDWYRLGGSAPSHG